MDILKLAAAQREETGSRLSRRLRENGFIPASLYAGGDQPTLLKLEANKWMRHLTDQLNLVNIEITGAGNQMAAVREIQRDPLSQAVIHVDFFKISMDQVTEFSVRIIFEGSPAGVSEGGVTTVASDFVAVECLPTDVPDTISVDISELEIGQSINAGGITLPEGLKLISDPGMTIVSITTIRVVEEEKPEEEVVEGEEVEVAEGEEKPAEGDEKAPEGDDKKPWEKKGFKHSGSKN